MAGKERSNGSNIEAGSPEERKPDEQLEQFLERQELAKRMSRIKHKIIVLSGKGGVGKSTVSANLAVSLALSGKKVGLLDIDIHGPSIPKLFNLEDHQIKTTGDSLVPINVGENMKVMSVGFLLPESDDAVIWRGPLKMGVIKQFLKDVEWGDLDYLVIDSPPGTGDEPLSICQLIEDADGGIIVTTPQEIAVIDVRKSINFCRSLNLKILGVIENMSGFVCPKCGEITNVFKSGGGDCMAREMSVPFLGKIPIDPQIVDACDSGKPYIQHYSKTETAMAFTAAIRPILEPEDSENVSLTTIKEGKENGKMRIAIPVAQGKLAMHFGHCESFALLDVAIESKQIIAQEIVKSPDHQPGLLPRFLGEKGANMIIAGGMGSRAQDLFAEQNIEVVVGAPPDSPEAIVTAYLEGTLTSGQNICDH